jgi:hypothetical protein
MKPPGGERFGNSGPSNAPDKQVTNGVVEANRWEMQDVPQAPKPKSWLVEREPQGPFIQEDMLPGLTRQEKGYGRAPTVDGEIALRATPEPGEILSFE